MQQKKPSAKKLIALAVGACAVLCVVSLAFGFGLGRGLASWRASRMTLPEVLAKIVEGTSRSVPQRLDNGWSYVSVEATPTAVVSRLIAPDGIDAAGFEAGADALFTGLTPGLCGLVWAERALERGGVFDYVFATSDGALSTTRQLTSETCAALRTTQAR